MSEENKPNPAEIESSKRQAAIFSGTHANIGCEMIPKITQSGMAILGAVGNRFVCGFAPAETAMVSRGNIMPFLIDVAQWREVCAASLTQRAVWMGDADSFRAHVFAVADSAPVNISAITSMFSDVLTAYSEIRDTQIEVKQPTDNGGAGKKKEAPSPQE